ncbi:potassium voltage-gated channel subfamily C member 3-like isoform X2 [Hemicordylus capensis]|nr:potassium voltage-gated channel subfamily C member 3-like isoform X2 [Hemicordylus capensis]
MKPSREKITLNVGGVQFETYLSTLCAFPGTKLGRLTEPQASAVFDYDPSNQEFFFDRSAMLFDEVLNYYRTQHLHCPEGTCRSVFEEELAFWEISDAPLASCCWQKFSDEESEEEGSCPWEEEQGGDQQGLLAPAERSSFPNSCRDQWQPKIWALFEKPSSSLSANVSIQEGSLRTGPETEAPKECLAIVSMLFNISICILFIGKTYTQRDDNRFLHYSDQHYNDTDELPEVKHHFYEIFPFLLPLELVFVLWFTFEFFMRLTFCPDRKKFLRNPLNVADFLSLFPVFIEFISLRQHMHRIWTLVLWLGFLRCCYILKLLKLFKLLEAPLMLRVLPYTFRSIFREILLLLLVFVFEALFFGAICHFAELLECALMQHQCRDIYMDNLPSSIWWAVITLTTVGYGDVYPITESSRIIGAFAAICGLLTILVPIPIFLIKFKGYYDAAIAKEKRKRMGMPTLPS